MKKALLWLGLVLFAAIQIADVAILDAAAYESHDTHAVADKDQGAPALDGCVLHCGCHATHHMNVPAVASSTTAVSAKDPLLALLSAMPMMDGQGPPVPPPNA
ncbi:MAG: hypothetical protein H3C28_01845 [Sphingomonadales bacterium]|nr:hypothetical protein [Sphingomonadales bacterium]